MRRNAVKTAIETAFIEAFLRRYMKKAAAMRSSFGQPIPRMSRVQLPNAVIYGFCHDHSHFTLLLYATPYGVKSHMGIVVYEGCVVGEWRGENWTIG